VRVTSSSGTVVAEVETDRRGAFSIDLDPGPYEVLAVTPTAGLATAASQRITVDDGAFVEVTLVVDTGIR